MKPILRLLIIGILIVSGSERASAATIKLTEPKASIPRDVDSNRFPLEITITGMTKEKASGEKYAHRLQITLPEHNANFIIPFDDLPDPDGLKTKVDFVLRENKAENVDKKDDGTITATVYLIFVGDSGALEELTEDDEVKNQGYVTVDVKYKESDGEDDYNDIQAKIKKGVPNEAPSDVSVEGKHRGLVASFNDPGEIEYTDLSEDEPTAVYMYAVRRGQGAIDVNGLIHDPSASQDTAKTTCTIDSDAENGATCATCETEGTQSAYMNKFPSSVKRSYTTDIESEQVLIDDLEEDEEYLVFLTFAKEGVERSACFVGIPYVNQTWSESIDDSLEAEKKEPRCFIATATFGSPHHADVAVFRQFRNNYLLTNHWGREVTEFYYQYSPPAAAYIETHPWAKQLAQSVLAPTADVLRWLQE